ncbi:MAG: ABC transporter ATP-binding protein [Burkholderiales bacterium]|nr:ABC transporter ATP-binding protein [Burkholderiales bacterium]
MAELLRLRGLIKRFGGLVATDGVDLTVQEGEVHALIGPNGAGKTTLVHLISGALRGNAGSVFFAGEELTHAPVHERVRRGLVRSYQVTSIFTRLSALDNALLAVQAAAGSSMRFWTPVRTERAFTRDARALLMRVGLLDRAEVVAGTLAHGEQRKLEVALALAARPRLLLLDEPLAGLGPEESLHMVELIGGLAGEVTIVLVEHDMDAVFKLAHRISVLVSGRIVATGAPDEIRSDARVRQAYLGDELGSAA